MTIAMSILLNGLVSGGAFAILAVGFSLVFGVAKILNVAHTAFYMLTSFLIVIFLRMGGFHILPACLSAIVITSVIGMLCYKFLFDRVKERETAVMIISMALAMLCQEILLLIFGGHQLRIPAFALGFVDIAGSRITYQQIIVIFSTGIILYAVRILLFKTRLGNAIRTVAEDREIANLMGINVTRIYIITMGISVALAGIAGAIVAPIYTVNPLMWMQPLVVVLAAVVLGGLGSVKGSVIAAFVLGFAETAVVFLAPSGSFLRGAISLIVMVIVLQFRPEGLFGVVFEEERL